MIRPFVVLAHAASIASALAIAFLMTPAARAAPTAEVAKKCLSYAYRVHPYKRPGSAKGSNERQLYFNDCVAKNGDIPEPPRAVAKISSDGKRGN